MKYLFLLVLFVGFFVTPAFAQEMNPTLIIDKLDIPAEEFNRILRDAPLVMLDDIHAVSWQVTIDNNLLYANPNGNAVLRLYDQETHDEFIEVGNKTKIIDTVVYDLFPAIFSKIINKVYIKKKLSRYSVIEKKL